MKTLTPDPPYEKPAPYPENRFKPFTSNCDDMPTLFFDTQAPLYVLTDAALFRIKAVTQVLENLGMRGSIECSHSSSVILLCSAPSRCAMAVTCWTWSGSDGGLSLPISVSEPSVARELAPAGLRSGPNTCDPVLSGTSQGDCFAVEREQAPSPQGFV